jgi:two-component system, LuxR family, sensor kinase FixL
VPNAPSAISDFMDKAIDQAGRAGEIIRRLRSFIERGETDRRGEDINKVIEEASALAMVGAKESGVRATFDFAADLSPVWIDKVQVQQVVVNLMRNAIEAMAQSPVRRLMISTRETDDAMVEVAIADSGPGLPPEIAARLFQPFTTSKEMGMGLGLSISRSIIDNMGGRLRADSNPNGGLIFRFTLPTFDHDRLETADDE